MFVMNFINRAVGHMDPEDQRAPADKMTEGWFKIELSRAQLKELLRPSDREGWKHIIRFFGALIVLGFGCVMSWGSWWFLPVYFSYCILWGGADAIWHECGHRTAFKTKRLNNFFYPVASFMNSFEPVRFRWSHSLHHAHTASVDPHDFEVEGSIFWRPKSLVAFLATFLPGIGLANLHRSLHWEILQHAFGVRTRVMEECIPEHKQSACVTSSRIFVLLWCVIIGSALLIGSWLPVFLFLIPKFFATPNLVWGLTQHVGLKDNVKDHRLSTRSVRLNPIISFIYWKMEYHIEHHMFPMVPSWRLPELHELIKHELPEPQTLFEAYRDIIPAVIKQTKDPHHFIEVTLPKSASGTAASAT